jgi:serine phosphatase RsbU (regulator of sigma subunit)
MSHNDDDDDASERTMIVRNVAPAQRAPEIAHFLVYAEGETLRRIPIGSAGLTIGRSIPAELVFPRPEISHRHCRIELDGEWAVATDLGSTNGTFLADARLDAPARLRNGARLSLGGVILRYERRDPDEVAQEAELASELRRAADYVRAILPAPLAEGPVRAEWCFVPSTQLGGDAFGYSYLGPDHFAGFVLDVSGHGIGSAMHAANVANALRRQTLPHVDFTDPAQVAAGLNAAFPMEEHNGLMLTLWYFTYHLPSRRLRFCAAGHHPSFLRAAGSPTAEPLWLRSPAIGMLPNPRWNIGEATPLPGSRLYVFSDGAFEILAANGSAWSIEDLRRLVEQGVEPDPQSIYTAVRAAARPGPLDDDFSVLAVTFR